MLLICKHPDACKKFLTLSLTANVCNGEDASVNESLECLFRASCLPCNSPFYLLILCPTFSFNLGKDHSEQLETPTPSTQPSHTDKWGDEGPIWRLGNRSGGSHSLCILQTLGVYSSAHIAPISAIQDYLSTARDSVDGLVTANAPNSTQFTQVQLYNQLETFGRFFSLKSFTVPSHHLHSKAEAALWHHPASNFLCTGYTLLVIC